MTDNQIGAMFSSATDEWKTPQDLYNRLDAIYHFELDAAATEENAKCRKYYAKEDNGLIQPWNGVVWCNPPYGREIPKWVRKGYEEAQKPGTTVVMLLPARTDTAWFHDYCKKGDVTFLRGRLKFSGNKWNAPFPSMIVKFGGQIRET